MFKYRGMLVGYAAFKKHRCLFPAGSGVEEFARQLKRYRTSRGTIQFPSAEALPDSLLKKIARHRVKENREGD